MCCCFAVAQQELCDEQDGDRGLPDHEQGDQDSEPGAAIQRLGWDRGLLAVDVDRGVGIAPADGAIGHTDRVNAPRGGPAPGVSSRAKHKGGPTWALLFRAFYGASSATIAAAGPGRVRP